MLIELTHNERLESMTNQRYEVLHDSPADGNCRFSSIAFALKDLGFFKSVNTLASDVVSYLDTCDLSADEYSMERFAAI